jgi:predicted O-methyltransferase YrrM
VNIGCGEGYYAVGLALRNPSAEVYAYDVNAEAVRLCRAMAALNGVADRVHVEGRFDEQALRALRLSGRGLVFADCEGCEGETFTESTLEVLARLDLVIEIHDFLDLSLSGRLRPLLARTHEVEVIESLDDIKKAQTYDYPELASFDLDVRRKILGELRPAIMEWLVCRPRRPES